MSQYTPIILCLYNFQHSNLSYNASSTNITFMVDWSIQLTKNSINTDNVSAFNNYITKRNGTVSASNGKYMSGMLLFLYTNNNNPLLLSKKSSGEPETVGVKYDTNQIWYYSQAYVDRSNLIVTRPVELSYNIYGIYIKK